MNKRKKITSMDIAKAAGVSQSTVSMILSGKKGASFSDETVRRVMEVASQLGYSRPQRKDADEADQAPKCILVFCPVVANPYYSTVVQAIEQTAYEQGFRTVLCTTYRNMDIERRHLAQAEEGDVAGIVFTNLPLHVEVVETISKRVPVVVIGDRDDRIRVDRVEVNSYQCGISVANYLMSLGHQRIAFLSSTLNNQNIIRLRRMEGVKYALEQSDPPCRLVVKSKEILSVEANAASDVQYKVGWELAMECIRGERVTAMIAMNDMIAYGALDALKGAGKRVPEDYSVCGFDNIFPSRLEGIQLTSVENYMIQKGRIAMDMLLKRIRQMDAPETGDHDSITRVEYQPRLIIRHSTGPAPGHALPKTGKSLMEADT